MRNPPSQRPDGLLFSTSSRSSEKRAASALGATGWWKRVVVAARLALLYGVLAGFDPSARAQTYRAIELPPPVEGDWEIRDGWINNHGEAIVAYADDSSGDPATHKTRFILYLPAPAYGLPAGVNEIDPGPAKLLRGYSDAGWYVFAEHHPSGRNPVFAGKGEMIEATGLAGVVADVAESGEIMVTETARPELESWETNPPIIYRPQTGDTFDASGLFPTNPRFYVDPVTGQESVIDYDAWQFCAYESPLRFGGTAQRIRYLDRHETGFVTRGGGIGLTEAFAQTRDEGVSVDPAPLRYTSYLHSLNGRGDAPYSRPGMGDVDLS